MCRIHCSDDWKAKEPSSLHEPLVGLLLLITALIGSHYMKTQIHKGNKVSTVKGSTVF
jgi:hypothetical protein